MIKIDMKIIQEEDYGVYLTEWYKDATTQKTKDIIDIEQDELE